MSEHTIPEERTEMPTDRRMGELRKEGAIHLSTDLVQVITLVFGFFVLGLVWDSLYEDMRLVLIKSFLLIGEPWDLTAQSVRLGVIRVILIVAPDVALITVTVAGVALLATMLQTNWNVKEKKIHFRWPMLNPISGVKRIFSIHGFMNLAKAVAKLLLILPIAYFALWQFAPDMVMLMHLTIPQVMVFTAQAMTTIFWRIVYVLIALAIFDYFWGKHQWLKTNKMTKSEVKDERKAIEGDEETKRKIINKGFQRIIMRLKGIVPQAHVIITNPTHYAVALRYERSSMSAPQVIAKGQGFIALRIRELAREAGVPIVERKALARALYASTEVGSEIPHELFRAVAEVLAYVYRLRGVARPTQEANS
jgi:flagellar biosynthetic protein FlhB